LGPYLTFKEPNYRYPTIARLAIAHKLNMETKAEELRVLYVALTRAREKLILIGSSPKLRAKTREWCQVINSSQLTLPDASIAGASSYLDWLGMALVRHPGGGKIRSFAEYDMQTGDIFKDDGSSWQIDLHSTRELMTLEDKDFVSRPLLRQVQNLEEVPLGSSAQVDNMLSWQYPFKKVVGIPAKMSVTEIKRRFDDADEKEAVVQQVTLRPSFIKQAGKLTASEYGTTLHTVLQQLKLTADLTESDIKEQIVELVAKEILLSTQAESVDTKIILTFLKSDLGKRLCAAERIYRELPFSRMLPAEKFYPELEGLGEKIFIQGIIDVLFREGDKLVLIDYKTDRASRKEELIEKYALQLRLYAEAVGAIYKQPVAEKYIYALTGGMAIKIED
jgi:ATP-dependent helicase/nuclease subunit A